ncbi:hypothetical protein ATANTOWER_010411, partial [Ataeniobius toweri]|nr:hypothetical protein [Ataeniobius toweri]
TSPHLDISGAPPWIKSSLFLAGNKPLHFSLSPDGFLYVGQELAKNYDEIVQRNGQIPLYRFILQLYVEFGKSAHLRQTTDYVCFEDVMKLKVWLYKDPLSYQPTTHAK